MDKLKADSGFKINYINAFHCPASSMQAFVIEISITKIYHVEKKQVILSKKSKILRNRR